jgi:hypothetical protein
MTTELEIENVMTGLENEDFSPESLIEEMDEVQPNVLAYLLSDNFELLTEDERNYLIYLGSIIWKSTSSNATENLNVSEELIIETEEKNWEIMNEQSGQSWRERLNPFFESTKEEDLLAFIEDGLADDEEEENPIVTKEGKELLFVGLKTVVDVLT